MDLREQIDAYIEKYKFEIVSRTWDFVKIPSVSTSDEGPTAWNVPEPWISVMRCAGKRVCLRRITTIIAWRPPVRKSRRENVSFL